ncbi:MAG TPA: hypothetical protein V6D12_03030 [Candidatus Obscuribacterales bacterium]
MPHIITDVIVTACKDHPGAEWVHYNAGLPAKKVKFFVARFR